MKQKSLFYSVGFLALVLAGWFFINKNSAATASTTDSFWSGRNQLMLLDFENELPAEITTYEDATVKLTDKKSTEGKQALRVDFKGGTKNPGITFKPTSPIDATSFKNYCLVFDATNITDDYSLQFLVSIQNDKGQVLYRSDVIPIGKTQTYFFELAGKYVGQDTGLRDDPKPWDTESVHMKIRGLKAPIDFSKIASINFFVQHPIADKSMILDNVRIVESPEVADDYLVGLFDKYGQAAKLDFEGKITSDAQLKKIADEELKQLQAGQMADRSQYGGWTKGPKLEATGYFRTEKVDGKWAMVDPEGYLYFSHGLANVRMANTTSFTGVDFRNDTVRYRDPEEVTPEDSRGMVKLSKEVTNTAYVAYPERNKMFTGLPSYDDPLANNYSYRREQHIGPFAHGETFSHYQANLERRYGEPTEGAHLKKWVDVTLDRFLNWGFTSFGNWAAYEFYHENRMPYFANGWIIGDFKTVASGYWGPMPDVFDPEFKRRADVTVKVIAEEVKGNPWCVGVFIDNEKSWGRPGSVATEHSIVLDALTFDAADHPIKAEFMKMLQAKHKTISSLNAAWKTDLKSWKALAKGIDYKQKKNFSEGMLADFSMMLEAYAHQYFQIVHDALETVLPNHMYMGCRFATWGMSKEVRSAAQKYVDIFSYNYYQEALSENYWKFLEDIDRPSIIGEFHIGTTAAGLFHPGLVIASDHQDRAKMYKKYMETVIDNPYFVGAHWFQYLDSPTSGRAHDGENYNVGFVRVTDVPYEPMVEAAKEITGNMYQRRHGK
ncbi:MAG: agarase, partial [Bacteroidota bacterium]